MHQRDDRTHSKLELEAERDIQHDQPQGQQHGQAALFAQFVTHLGTHEFDAAQLHPTGEGVLQDSQ